MKTAHTPTPWIVGHLTKLFIFDREGHEVAACSRTLSQPMDLPTVNAAFIVRAVNAYDRDQQTIQELTEALERTVKAMENTHEGRNRPVRIHIIEDTRAALAAARGKEGA